MILVLEFDIPVSFFPSFLLSCLHFIQKIHKGSVLKIWIYEDVITL